VGAAAAGTGALKLLAEAFPWRRGGTFAYTADNHNSVVGMREEALAAGAAAVAVVPEVDVSGAAAACLYTEPRLALATPLG